MTISLNCDIVGGGREGDIIEAAGEVVKVSKDRSLVFVSVRVFCGSRALVTGRGLIKKMDPSRASKL